jgi:hypothetical protein
MGSWHGVIDGRDCSIELRIFPERCYRSCDPHHVAHRDNEESGVRRSNVGVHLVALEATPFHVHGSSPLPERSGQCERKLVR